MSTPIQNFDLYELGGNTAADMYGDEETGKVSMTAEIVRTVVEQHGGRSIEDSLSLYLPDDRETLIHALIKALHTNT